MQLKRRIVRPLVSTYTRIPYLSPWSTSAVDHR